MITPLAATSNESDLLIYKVSDEVLETAGNNKTAAAFTLGSCTGLSECPLRPSGPAIGRLWRGQGIHCRHDRSQARPFSNRSCPKKHFGVIAIGYDRSNDGRTLLMAKIKMSKKINRDRRRFFGTAAMTVAAASLALSVLGSTIKHN